VDQFEIITRRFKTRGKNRENTPKGLAKDPKFKNNITP
jgi:hypothetical protein